MSTEEAQALRPAGGDILRVSRRDWPMPRTSGSFLSPDSKLIELQGIGHKRASALARNGFGTVADLLFHLPFRYEDRRHQTAIADLDDGRECMIVGRLTGLERLRLRRRGMTLVRGWIEDQTGRLPVLWFNRPYLVNQVQDGGEYALFGPIRRRSTRLEMVNPTCEQVASASHCGRILPVYQSVGQLGPAFLRRLIAQILQRLDPLLLEDKLPVYLRRKYDLPQLRDALTMLHAPGDIADIGALNERSTAAHARLAYEEFLRLQVELALLRDIETQQEKAHSYRLDETCKRALEKILPFSLTSSQSRVVEEIAIDLGRTRPMLRLLQGDVGSGKTIVAALAMVMAMQSGLQGAFMAPTELLAEQHFRTFTRLLGGGYRVGLLSSSVKEPNGLRQQIASGELQLVVGTHALIQESVEFHRLALVVIDEQHRFGVAQRKLLQRKGIRPDVLVITATPIPRSLALTVYGDLSLSVIDELPPGRHPVITSVTPASSRQRLYSWLNQQLDLGAQAYVVFPLIDDSESLDAASIASLGEAVRETLGRHRSAVLHGRIGGEERERIMQKFLTGELQALIATTVVEVGLDVPNASVMVIESSERFGLAQLHQLRGRVGRGERKSYCVAIHGRLSGEAKRRLKVFAAVDDGFKIAEADLELRGPGDLLGTRQSGLPWFRAADVLRHHVWLDRARADARELIGSQVDDAAVSQLVAEIRALATERYRGFAGG